MRPGGQHMLTVRKGSDLITYRLLNSADSDSLHSCFLTAFSDYVVPMKMGRDEFHQRLVRDGVDLELSVGAFSDDVMIGFSLNAIGDWRGLFTAYDAGTGVVPGFRGRGVGKELFAFMMPQLIKSGVKQCLLEVISTNEPAVALYVKLGFKEVRRLNVFLTDALSIVSRPTQLEMKAIREPDWKLLETFWDGYPSWQNSIDSVERLTNEKVVIAAFQGSECIGYGAVFLPTCNLMQLAVARSHRRNGVGSSILSALQSEVASVDALKVINVDKELVGSNAFYLARGFKVILDQQEMVLSL